MEELWDINDITAGYDVRNMDEKARLKYLQAQLDIFIVFTVLYALYTKSFSEGTNVPKAAERF